MDILDDILATLDLRGALYFRSDFSSPWSVRVPELAHAARFHFVVQGECHVLVADTYRVHLATGDLILVPRGRSHILADREAEEAPALEQVLEQSGYDGRGVLVVGAGDEAAATRTVCGHFTFRQGADHPLLRALPDYIVLTSDERVRHPLLDQILGLIAERLFGEVMGSEAAVIRMSEIVFIELLRVGIGQDTRLREILEGFRDKHIGQALNLIHEDPAQAWSVESLASAAGMSRSRFAEYFSAKMGVGPMAYLTDWRLQKALPLLGDVRISVQQVAGKVGYKSPASFSRAFTTKFGMSPSDYRRKT